MGIPFTDILRQMRRGAIVEALTARFAEVNAAVKATGKAGSLTLSIKIKPDKGGGRQFELVPSVSFSVPQPDLPASIFFINDEGDLVRTDPDQAEMFGEVPARAYTPPAEVKTG